MAFTSDAAVVRPSRSSPLRHPTVLIAIVASLAGCDASPTGPGGPLAWSEPQRILSLGEPFTDLPAFRTMDLSAAPDGSLHLLMLGRDPAGSSFMWQTAYHVGYANGQWSAPRRFAENPTQVFGPRAVGDLNGTLHLVWYENLTYPDEPSVTHLRYRRATGGVWSEPATLDDVGRAVPIMFGAALDDGGRVNVVYVRGSGEHRHAILEGGGIAASRPTGHFGGHDLTLVAARGGLVDYAWIGTYWSPGETGEQQSNVLYGAGQNDGAMWGPIRVVHRDDAQASHSPSLVMDSRRVRHLVWAESLPGEFVPARIMYSRSSDGVAWTAPAEISDRRAWITTLSLHVDGHDRVHLIYAQDEQFWERQVRYARLEGGRWSASEAPFPELGSVNGLHSTITPGGELHLVWQRSTGARHADYYHAVLR